MTKPTEHRARTEEERAYYSLSALVYAIFAPFYDTVAFPLRRLRREVARAVDLAPGTRVLDVATGTGEQAFAFADKAREVVGIDLSHAMLRVAWRKNRWPNVSFDQADAANLPFEDASFDASSVSFALHEMPVGIRERVVREMARVTKPGGCVAIVDYALPRNRVASSIAFHAVKLYEGDRYADFVRTDIDALLRHAGIEPLQHRSALGGLAKIVTGRRNDALVRATSTAPRPARALS